MKYDKDTVEKLYASGNIDVKVIKGRASLLRHVQEDGVRDLVGIITATHTIFADEEYEPFDCSNKIPFATNWTYEIGRYEVALDTQANVISLKRRVG